jgi:hypothetical protein
MIGCVLFSSIEVAYAVAEGDPPKWLVRSLEHFRVIKPSRDISAAVVIEAWRLLHGKVGPREKLYAACKMYWGVCGGEEYEAFDDWHQPAGDYSWLRDIIERYKRGEPNVVSIGKPL